MAHFDDHPKSVSFSLDLRIRTNNSLLYLHFASSYSFGKGHRNSLNVHDPILESSCTTELAAGDECMSRVSPAIFLKNQISLRLYESENFSSALLSYY